MSFNILHGIASGITSLFTTGNPIAAGAGKSYEDHLPNVTGISVLAPTDDMLDLLRKYFPQYKRIGLDPNGNPIFLPTGGRVRA